MDFSQKCTKMQKSVEFYGFFHNPTSERYFKRLYTEMTSELCSKFRKWLNCAAYRTKSHGKWPLTGPGLGNLQYVHGCPCMSVHDLRISVS